MTYQFRGMNSRYSFEKTLEIVIVLLQVEKRMHELDERYEVRKPDDHSRYNGRFLIDDSYIKRRKMI